MSPARFRRVMNLWPPYLFSGIQITHIAEDFRAIDVCLQQHWYNRNIYGTHFGGSLFAMTDPFYVIMLTRVLGRDFIIWDKTSTIEFVKPGRGRVTASFAIDDVALREIRSGLETSRKVLKDFSTRVVDVTGDVVASVTKTIYIRRKPAPGGSNEHQSDRRRSRATLQSG